MSVPSVCTNIYVHTYSVISVYYADSHRKEIIDVPSMNVG